MNALQKIDLHLHSNISDGTDSPAELLENVRGAGLSLFALTDHDAVKGCSAIMKLLTTDDPEFVTGVEFSCKDEEGQYHILGYGFDPDAEPIKRVVDTGHRYRIEKLYARLRFLKEEFGINFNERDKDTLYSLDNPGKPHIGNLLVKYGYAKTKEEAIREFLNKKHFGSEYVRPEEAIKGILEGGGIPVLAHPAYGNGDQLILGEDPERRLEKLISFGLQGIEAFYSGFTAKLRRSMISFAERYGLYVTAGSDYHGSNKMIEIGDTGLGEEAVIPEGLLRFIERISG